MDRLLHALACHDIMRPSLSYYRLLLKDDPFAMSKYESALAVWEREHESIRRQFNG
jgi:hypothetical protein